MKIPRPLEHRRGPTIRGRPPRRCPPLLAVGDRGGHAGARGARRLYAAHHKWSGPGLWRSWRRDLPGAARHAPVQGYNGYVVDVPELYCGGCDLFLGHAFADARDKGDAHPDARWRH